MPNLYQKTVPGIPNGHSVTSVKLCLTLVGVDRTQTTALDQQTTHDWLSRASALFFVTFCFIPYHHSGMRPQPKNKAALFAPSRKKGSDPSHEVPPAEHGCQTVKLLKRGHPAMNKLQLHACKN